MLMPKAKIWPLCFFICWSLACLKGFATEAKSDKGFVVVASLYSPISSLTEYQLANIFLNKVEEIHGIEVQPIDLELWEGAKENFYTTITHKNASQLNAYWARKLFTGRAKPPRQLPNTTAIYHYLYRNKYALAYMAVDSVDLSKVKVIYPPQ